MPIKYHQSTFKYPKVKITLSDVTAVLPRKQVDRPSIHDRPVVLSLLSFVTSFDLAQTWMRRGHRKVGNNPTYRVGMQGIGSYLNTARFACNQSTPRSLGNSQRARDRNQLGCATDSERGAGSPLIQAMPAAECREQFSHVCDARSPVATL
eukprot:1948837-Pleurochrysis_carterae.AAC.1